MIVILMGVCGCGKTTIAQLLSDKVGWPIAEADDYHTPENKAKMARGIPLEDQDRLPWLLALHQVIQRWLDEGSSGIITCSSLKKIYREIILNGNVGAEDFAEDKNPSRINGAAFPPQNVKFVYLKGDKETIAQRMQMRTGHFMPPSLVESQFQTLEEPTEDENCIIMDIAEPPDRIVEKIIHSFDNIGTVT
ncbi:probable gluconokinase [Lingula anatina]|uniref:Probable gluconokinase n=1 Tax=Lingula anatina TaxID=7574 RepID=A0A1S3K615_LINAN|nr:probable gluconokinase [Lingula anatina]|eukprot:XP_013417696.1 probable gluconokinase [Lingula anatina]